tara:strand:+ start:849 stop:1055 length:207 start_codon:yes stop_codon:yes gene_type:complete
MFIQAEISPSKLQAYITMRLFADVTLPTVTANRETNMKYIQEHYFHDKSDESIEILGKGRKIKPVDKI